MDFDVVNKVLPVGKPDVGSPMAHAVDLLVSTEADRGNLSMVAVALNDLDNLGGAFVVIRNAETEFALHIVTGGHLSGKDGNLDRDFNHHYLVMDNGEHKLLVGDGTESITVDGGGISLVSIDCMVGDSQGVLLILNAPVADVAIVVESDLAVMKDYISFSTQTSSWLSGGRKGAGPDKRFNLPERIRALQGISPLIDEFDEFLEAGKDKLPNIDKNEKIQDGLIQQMRLEWEKGKYTNILTVLKNVKATGEDRKRAISSFQKSDTLSDADKLFVVIARKICRFQGRADAETDYSSPIYFVDKDGGRKINVKRLNESKEISKRRFAKVRQHDTDTYSSYLAKWFLLEYGWAKNKKWSVFK